MKMANDIFLCKLDHYKNDSCDQDWLCSVFSINMAFHLGQNYFCSIHVPNWLRLAWERIPRITFAEAGSRKAPSRLQM